MKDMITAQLLASLDVPQADAALVDWGALFGRSVHILQLFQLNDELAPLDKRDPFVTQRAQVVGDLAEDVDGQSAAAHDDEEEAQVDDEVTRVKYERDDVEDELFFEPLLVVAQLEK